MAGPRDTRAANWAKTVRRLRRAALELQSFGFKVVEPESLEIPPHRRIAEPSTVK